MLPAIVALPTHSHTLGDLTHIHGGSSVPFSIRRVYYVHGIPASARRGGHAHRTNDEMVIAVTGAFTVEVEDVDGRRTEFKLSEPSRGLLVPARFWRRLYDYTGGAVCLVLASMPYDPDEYIRDYGEFRSLAG